MLWLLTAPSPYPHWIVSKGALFRVYRVNSVANTLSVLSEVRKVEGPGELRVVVLSSRTPHTGNAVTSARLAAAIEADAVRGAAGEKTALPSE